MPSRPPETRFYEDADNAMLWRNLSREYEEFMGTLPNEWPERQERFVIVINDMLVRFREASERPGGQ